MTTASLLFPSRPGPTRPLSQQVAISHALSQLTTAFCAGVRITTASFSFRRQSTPWLSLLAVYTPAPFSSQGLCDVGGQLATTWARRRLPPSLDSARCPSRQAELTPAPCPLPGLLHAGAAPALPALFLQTRALSLLWLTRSHRSPWRRAPCTRVLSPSTGSSPAGAKTPETRRPSPRGPCLASSL